MSDIGAAVKLISIERGGISPGTRNPPFEFNNHLNLDITSSDLFIAIRVKNSGDRPAQPIVWLRYAGNGRRIRPAYQRSGRR